MAFFLNELSLHGQYTSTGAFLQALTHMIQLKNEIEKSGGEFLCCDHLRSAQVTESTTFQAEIAALTNAAQRLTIIRWFDRNNWLSLQEHDSNDEFLWGQLDVTGFSMSEAAFRLSMGENAALVSFHPSRCGALTLRVSWETAGNDAIVIEIENHWSVDKLVSAVQLLASDTRSQPVQSWPQLIDWGRQYCHHLIFPDFVLEQLNGVPFSLVVAQQAQRRFEVLDKLKEETDNQGERTSAGHQLYQTHFIGERAWFTDESETNKQKFETEMTFPNPMRTEEEIFCPWHGKISTQNFRIHFTWPLQQITDPISVVYIGPKITKG